ncbi:hypothetical protein [Natronosalvus vescus]|uniref:hypothetical protein n=1 Tax=Natronosalvus vescus TaxID=2953881 RepID=UPI0020915660|nr:hypothetical protein [Natronosalvus vescus]
MRRRRFLAGMAGASATLAGCTALGNGDDPSDRAPYGSADPDWIDDGDDVDANGDEEPPDDEGSEGPTVSLFDEPTVVDFETAPLTAAVIDGSTFTADGLAVAVDFERPATAASPATLTATVANQHSFEQTFRSRRLPGLDSPTMLRRRDPDRHVVFLAPTPEHPFAETTPTYDRDENGRWRLESTTGEWFPETITLDPEETVVGEYVLLGHPDSTEPAIGAGRYRIGRGDGGFTIACWSSERPGPETTSTFEGVTVPSLPDDQPDPSVPETGESDENTGTRWFHEATPETAVFLEADTESITAPGSITFSLVNHGRDTLQGNPYHWRLYKLVDGRWLPIEPWGWPMPMGRLSPGDVHESTLACYAGEPVACDHARSVGHLGGGRYAYTAGYSGGAESNAHAAIFDLEAPAVAVDLEDDAVVDRRDEKTVVTLPEYGEGRQPATMTVTHSSDDPDQQLLPEQLYRQPFRSLRNTLPAFESGVQTVHLRADRNVVGQPFREADTDAHTIRYEDTVFEVSWSLEDE